MAIEIRANRGIFELHGSLCAQNLGGIRMYFLHILENQEDVVINVESMETIDSSALKYLRQLPELARSMNRNAHVIGLERPIIEDGQKEIDERNG